MSKYIIMHGQLVELTDDELMHWKYIKREKKNGRWVYYYDEAAANRDDGNNYQKALNAERHQFKRSLQLTDAEKRLAETGATKDQKIYYGRQVEAYDDYKLARENAKRAEKAATRAWKKYHLNNVKNFAARTISKGTVKVANLFSGLFSKKK